jgi:glycosyltransferase involved in cell wall biosynthesis
LTIRKVTVFVNGDSTQRKTWSNVPFFFCKALEDRGIIVNRVNVQDADRIKNGLVILIIRIYNKLIRVIVNKHAFLPNSLTWIYQRKVKKIINKGIADFSDSDLAVSISFSFNARNKKGIKTVMFSDWPLSYSIAEHFKRSPDVFEKIAINRQDKILKGADYILTLFPETQIHMERKLKKKVIYLGNVVNSEKKIMQNDFEYIATKKYHSRKLLFVGGDKYYHGAIELIKATDILRNSGKYFEVHIVGMERGNFDAKYLQDNVYFYGYLDKDIEDDSRLYYTLIEQAELIVNTTPMWGGFSAICEAAYFLTPIICGYYPDFIRTFGVLSQAAQYCENDRNEISKAVNKIDSFEYEIYKNVCIEIHNKVEDFTWDKYVDRLLIEINGEKSS